MNCRDVNHLLDSSALANLTDLTTAEREAVDDHLSSCGSCAAEWANWREVAALGVPAMPAGLRERIAAALPARAAASTRQRGRARRPFVVGGLLVAGTAAAAVAWQSRQPTTGASMPSVVAAPQESGPLPRDEQAISPAAAEPIGTAPATAQPGPAPVAAAAEPAAASPGIALDPLSIVVLQRPEAAADEAAIAGLATCHDAVVAQLRINGGLNVIAGADVGAYADSGLPDAEIARALGAGSVLVLDANNGCDLSHRDVASGARLSGGMYGGRLPSADGFEAFARGRADSIGGVLLKQPSEVVAEARANLLDTTLSDGRRIASLNDFWNGLDPVPGAFDSAVIAAAAEIGLNSPDAGARASAWANLRRVDDAYLVEPMLQALANDADETVRMQAAVSLNTFLDEPGVRDALLRTAAEDPSREPTVPCCIRTVREAAERASVPSGELADFARGKLLDASLPSRSRLLPIAGGSPDGRFVTAADLGAEAAPAIFGLGRSEPDPRVRQMAWSALAATDYDESYVPALIDELRNHPDEYVRSTAAGALWRHLDNPAVRTAFAEAEQDPSIAVRRRVMMESPQNAQP